MWTLRLFPSGKRAEAVSQLRAATELDPLSPKDLNALNFILMNVGGYDEVIANAKRTLAINPTDYSSLQLMGRALVQKGLVNDGIAVFEKLGTGAEGFLGYSYAKVGRRAEAEQLIKKFPDFPWIQALISGGLGNKDRAIKGLEKMVVIKDPRTGIYLTMPELAILRGDPRVTNIRAELGLNQNQ